jgi:predicted  nucleic acid-binding Zn-ribbon protein
MKKSIIYLVFISLISLVIYFSLFKNNRLINTTHHDLIVDSLNNVISKNDKKIDSLNFSVSVKEERINKYESDLANLKNKLNKEKKQHEKDINRINSISNKDISTEFTNAFK